MLVAGYEDITRFRKRGARPDFTGPSRLHKPRPAERKGVQIASEENKSVMMNIR
jgi:hypothetical protein